jgi:hypothetical protein
MSLKSYHNFPRDFLGFVPFVGVNLQQFLHSLAVFPYFNLFQHFQLPQIYPQSFKCVQLNLLPRCYNLEILQKILPCKHLSSKPTIHSAGYHFGNTTSQWRCFDLAIKPLRFTSQLRNLFLVLFTIHAYAENRFSLDKDCWRKSQGKQLRHGIHNWT